MFAGLKEFIALFFPKTCIACERLLFQREDYMCLYCEQLLPKTDFHNIPDSSLAQLFWGRVNLQYASAMYYFDKGGSIQKMLHRIKYFGDEKAAVEIGRIYGLELSEAAWSEEITDIIAVPLHPGRKRERGFNQSALIAQGLSESLGIPCKTSSLIRKKKGDSQTRSSFYARWDKVKDSFEVVDLKEFESKHVLLVDDVITSGATIESCAKQLLRASGSKVSIAAIAVA